MSTNDTAGPSKVVVETQPGVDPKKPEVIAVDTSAAKDEPSMEEYAAMRERGEEFKPAAKPSDAKPAAATDTSAAATEEDADKKPAGEEDPEKLLEEAHPAKKGISERMSKLANDRKESQAAAEVARAEAEKARQEAKAAQEELAKLKAEAEARAALPEVIKAEDDPKPDRENFNDPDEFAEALAAHAVRQELRKSNEAAIALRKAQEEKEKVETEKARQAQAAEQVAALHKGFQDRVAVAKVDYPDFDEKVTNNDKLQIRNDIFFAIEKAELAPHILYHLANNPEEVATLAKLSPLDAAIRIGEIQSEVRIARKPKPSKAAAPVKPVGNRTNPEKKSLDEMSMEEYAKMRDDEEAAKRAAKQKRYAQS